MYEDGGLDTVHEMAAFFANERGTELFRKFLGESKIVEDLFNIYILVYEPPEGGRDYPEFYEEVLKRYLPSFAEVLKTSYALGHVDGLQGKSLKPAPPQHAKKNDNVLQLRLPGVLD